jgi:cytoskeletal protein CcmA (bactofilin family)
LIKGSVEAQNNIEMTEDACILGDLTTQNITVDGRIKGNMTVRGNGIFKKKSIVLGNVQIGTIIAEAGARLKGFITTTGDKEVSEELF